MLIYLRAGPSGVKLNLSKNDYKQINGAKHLLCPTFLHKLNHVKPSMLRSAFFFITHPCLKNKAQLIHAQL